MPDTPPDGSGASSDDDDTWARLAAIPDLDDQPIDDPAFRRRLERDQPLTPSDEPSPTRRRLDEPTATEPVAGGDQAPSAAAPDERRYYVPAPDPATAPPAPPATPGGPAQEPPLPRPAPDRRRPARRPRTRRRWPWWVASVALLVLIALLGMLLYANHLWGRIERVEVSSVLSEGGTGTNYLIVGTDSREGIDPDNPNAGAIIGEPVSGERSDTIVVLHIGPDGNRMLSLNRDLWVSVSGTGGQERINTALANGGPATLIRTVQENFGIPVHHYMEVDLAGFLDLVDALGGITITFEYPAYDPKSGLNVTQTGPVHLDADEALAFVRSRNYIEIVDGQERLDPTADLGRAKRQQEFLRAVFDEAGSTRNPFKLTGVLSAMTDALVIDDDMSFWHAVGLARKLGGLNPETVTLPVFGFTTPGGAAVLGVDGLGVDGGAAEQVLDGFR